jgi:cell division protease FtsH
MKFSVAALMALLVADKTLAFAPQTPLSFSKARTSPLSMALDMPPAPEQKADVSVVQQRPNGQPTEVRYSEFLTMVNNDRVEKITFSADGTQLLGVDVDGARLKIESLPNDPDLLTQLTSHKVRVCFRVEGNQDMLHAILVRMRSNNVFISNYFSG